MKQHSINIGNLSLTFFLEHQRYFTMQNANYPNIISPDENKNNLKVEINFSYSLIKQVLIYLIIIYEKYYVYV